MRLRKLLLLSSAIALFAGSSLHAAPIDVNFHSFERGPNIAQNWVNELSDPNTPDASQWVGRDGTNNGDAFLERIGGFSADGLDHVGLQNGYYIAQNTGVAWEPFTRYTLTVGVGNRNTGFSPSGSEAVIGLTVVEDPPELFNQLTGFDTDDQLLSDDLLMEASLVIDSGAIATSTYEDHMVVYETEEEAPDGNVVIFLGDALTNGRAHFDDIRLDALPIEDADGDGLPTVWEVENGLNPASDVGDDGAEGDPDGDGSENLEEFERGTKPNDSDTDDDMALDGQERPGALGTDPLNPDTDGDTLLDGEEVATSPLMADTDEDGFEDQAEIAAATDPASSASFPANAADVLFGFNFIGGGANAEGASVSSSAGVVPQGNWNNLATLSGLSNAVVNSTGDPSILRVQWNVDNTATISGDIPGDDDGNSELMHGYLRTRADTPAPTMVEVRNIPYPEYDVYIYADGAELDGMADYMVNGESIIGVMDNDNWPVGGDGGSFTVVRGDNEAGNVILFEDVTGPTLTVIASLANAPINGVQIVRAELDTDQDGMPNLWEDANDLDPNVNDAAEDPDEDGLNNIDEFNAGSDPQDDDSDDDGLKDGVETGTGTFVDASDTGSNPLRADSDEDGLSDGVETGSGVFVSAQDTGTDPNNSDSDGDTWSDSQEVAANTDPNNAGSKPNFPVVIGYWSFDDQGADSTEDLSSRGNTGTVLGEAVYDVGFTGSGGDFALCFDGIDDAVTTELSLDDLEFFTMAGWVKFPEAQGGNRVGLFGQNDANEFGLSDPSTLSWWTSGTPQINVGFGPTQEDWIHVAAVGGPEGRQLFIGGQQVADQPNAFPQVSSGDLFNIGGDGVWDPADNWFLGCIDDVAVWDVELSAPQIEALAAGEINPLGNKPGQSEVFQITDIVYDAEAGIATLTFPTRAGGNYSAEASDDLQVWLEFEDLQASGSESELDAIIPLGQTFKYYRVRLLD